MWESNREDTGIPAPVTAFIMRQTVAMLKRHKIKRQTAKDSPGERDAGELLAVCLFLQ